jgi:hypothetical protein
VFVSSSTRFERTSFARLRAGSRIEATIRRAADGRWVAGTVQTRGGGGRRGGGSDDGPNHT